MFIHNINPVIYSIGPFKPMYYGLVYVIGFLLVYYFLHIKKEELKLTKKDVQELDTVLKRAASILNNAC